MAIGFALCLAMSACSSSGSPKAALQTKMNAVVDAANVKDAAALRTALDAFMQEVAGQSQNGDITTIKAQDLRTVAERVLGDAALLEDAPSPSPVSSPSASPSPSPRPSPSPSPSPPPSPSPSPSPDAVPSVVVTSSPALVASPVAKQP